MSDKKYKIVKAFYCFHPEIVINEKPRHEFWGLEWTVWFNNQQKTIGVHYMRELKTEKEAQDLLNEIQLEVGEYSPWKDFEKDKWYLSPKYKKYVLGQKKRVISPIAHYELTQDVSIPDIQ